MKTDDFDYFLPAELIAQYPIANRADCRLLNLDKTNGNITDCLFSELERLLKPGDCLVFNDTKVMPYRLFCKKESGGVVELLLTEEMEDGSFKALVKSSKKINIGSRLELTADSTLKFEITGILSDGARQVILCKNPLFISLIEVARKYGSVALPHYIKRPVLDSDNETYQTIYAKNEGAIAAPTAGLHFTEEVFNRLSNAGVRFAFITLHVGIGTFRPVKVADPRMHHMHEERFIINNEAAKVINDAIFNKGRIIAVGTTVIRTLEHCVQEYGKIIAATGKTDMMILPGHKFGIVNGIITNFHVPRSTLLMLISAFAGRENVLKAYSHAVEKKYRFFSYGDAMAIL